jgi:predicted RNA polymerase sigma factor
MSAETKVSALAKLNKSRIKLDILTSGKIILLDNQKSTRRKLFYKCIEHGQMAF